MTELLFGLTVLFIGYVIYEVFKTVSTGGTPAPAAEVPPPAEVAAVVAAPAPEAVPPTEPTASPAAEKGPLLRNPADGETSPAPRNYRFAKKWIKEALVAEGLLPKVYKNSELTVNVSEKVKAALDAFKALEKYQA
ncbi:hypothetical protein [Methylococcus sp. EFPC2]|uniref:hypothetical protein n=1 Tax=Methylococcus sp. EFPC2 TaxID=2812648 RepID=UPI001967A158|nr:hypothetical protein [Methylococcus sp. EFPC2]QSA96288.1 hypothetical protein JWZ97_13795 [Methylococcus sp. EFPC2]